MDIRNAALLFCTRCDAGIVANNAPEACFVFVYCFFHGVMMGIESDLVMIMKMFTWSVDRPKVKIVHCASSMLEEHQTRTRRPFGYKQYLGVLFSPFKLELVSNSCSEGNDGTLVLKYSTCPVHCHPHWVATINLEGTFTFLTSWFGLRPPYRIMS